MEGGFPKTQIPAEPGESPGRKTSAIANVSLWDRFLLAILEPLVQDRWAQRWFCRPGRALHTQGSAWKTIAEHGRSWACRGWENAGGQLLTEEDLEKALMKVVRTVAKEGKAETRTVTSRQSVQKIKARQGESTNRNCPPKVWNRKKCWRKWKKKKNKQKKQWLLWRTRYVQHSELSFVGSSVGINVHRCKKCLQVSGGSNKHGDTG